MSSRLEFLVVVLVLVACGPFGAVHAESTADRSRLPEIVDAKTLARAYERFGFTRRAGFSRVDFDTAAAIGKGNTIWREMSLRADGD